MKLLRRIRLVKLLTWRITLLSLLATGFTLLVSCELPPRTPAQFPDTDIVFQIASNLMGDLDLRLGFVNSDGTGLAYISIAAPSVSRQVSSPIYPQIVSDNSILIARGASATGHPGRLAVIPAGEKAVICSDESDLIISHLALTTDQRYVVANLVGLPTRIALFDLNACMEGSNQYLTVFNIPSQYEPCTGGGAALSPNGQMLAFPDCSNHKAKIIILDLENATGINVGRGFAPAWSHNGDWLAYRGPDGLNIASPDGTEEHHLIKYKIPEEPGRSEDWPPLPSWSPDGQWLTYHKCTLPSWPENKCTSIEDFAIFKVNIETGEEIKILDGGLNPYWRWHQDAP